MNIITSHNETIRFVITRIECITQAMHYGGMVTVNSRVVHSNLGELLIYKWNDNGRKVWYVIDAKTGVCIHRFTAHTLKEVADSIRLTCNYDYNGSVNLYRQAIRVRCDAMYSKRKAYFNALYR